MKPTRRFAYTAARRERRSKQWREQNAHLFAFTVDAEEASTREAITRAIDAGPLEIIELGPLDVVNIQEAAELAALLPPAINRKLAGLPSQDEQRQPAERRPQRKER